MKALLRTIALAVTIVFPTTAFAQTILIRLGTVAPQDSPWYEVINRMGQDWKKASNGRIEVKIHAGGVLGDENEMLQKVKLGQLQGVGLSGVGLARIAPGVGALQLPMLVNSFEDLDRVRTGLEPRLKSAIEKAGFKVVNFSDVGWVHFFTKEKARTPADLKKLRLFINADDPDSEKLYLDLGFRPVPLGVTDLLTSLKTGLIDAFDVPPLFALSDQSFAVAKHMIDVKWAPLIGATVIDKRVWERIPAALRPELERIAAASGVSLRAKIRASGDEAIAKMKQYGLIVETPTAAEMTEWRAMAKTARDKLRERGIVPAADLDEAVRLSTK
jgi:TRAP-type C4-dicarboxylate transport system substrate-binding protein